MARHPELVSGPVELPWETLLQLYRTKAMQKLLLCLFACASFFLKAQNIDIINTSLNQSEVSNHTTKKPCNSVIMKVGAIDKSTTTVKELMLQESLVLFFPDCLKPFCDITSFSFATSRKLKKDIYCIGSYFTPKVYAAIKKLKRGDKAFFDNIKVNGPDGTTRSLAPFFLTIE